MNNIIIDSGFWYALYDPRDPYHKKANELVPYLEMGNILIPFPTLYEVINTRFTRRIQWMSAFNQLLSKGNVLLIEDSDYKAFSLELTFGNALAYKKPISLVDAIIRAMLDDNTLNIHGLITFNGEDFRDICTRRNIELLD